jgi:hypothetical protein
MLMSSNWTRRAILRAAHIIFRLKGYAGLLLLAGLLVGATNARAEDINGDYLRIFFQIQRADSISIGANPAAALPKYIEARTNLFNLQRKYPNFSPRMVSYRLSYLENKIASFSSSIDTAKPVRPRPAPVVTPPESKPVETNTPETQPSRIQTPENKSSERLPEQP